MTILSGILSLFILVLVAIGFFVIWRGLKGAKKSYVSKRYLKWLIRVYVSVLVLSIIWYSLLSVSNRIEDVPSTSGNFYDIAVNQSVDEIDPAFIGKQWSMDYGENMLNIGTVDHEYLETPIIVYRSDRNNRKISATYYKKLVVSENDYSKEVKSIDLTLNQDKLLLYQPAQPDFKIVLFKKEFTIRQFTEEKLFEKREEDVSAQSLLYISIPKDLTLIAEDGLNIHYLDD
ncbi:hypothetical protein ACIQD3_13580 [Peribacillus loiseleuriae]|uniref:hypothetical protein n=1 Tax=Peribacillus loiseleuriae TaxID=1679170 RepID=UPI0037FDACDB